MEMRKLSSMDLFPLLNIMAKIGIKDLIQEVFKKRAEYVKKDKEGKAKADNAEADNAEADNAEADNAMVGAEVLAQITELVFLNIGRAQNEINTLLAKLCNVAKADIEKLSMSEYVGLVTDFLAQEEFKASLNVIMSSFK
ncbi:MAG: hypothetical protein SA378_11585 [Sedimentibacter sp.]|uniref:hypothetical protein n=1 Tax=Sedimentibacter sp. TaxID=1960295 RepID=UPI0029810D52|nr:hypothetical protein [Sedimentibacter sp.]MDW5300757.1 hypothetical protein [Sedimentibacter sp.]